MTRAPSCSPFLAPPQARVLHSSLVLCLLCGCSSAELAPVEGVLHSEAGTDASSDPYQEPLDEPETQAPYSFDVKRVRADIAKLTSQEFEGRLPGTAGGERSLQYVETRFQELGLKPVGTSGYRQPFVLPLWVKTGASQFVLAGTPLAEGSDFDLLMYAGSGAATGQVVFAGYGLTVPPFAAQQYPSCPFGPTGYDDYAGVEVTGKIVVVLRHGPAEDLQLSAKCPANSAAKAPDQLLYFGYKVANAKLHGAAAVVFVEDWSHGSEPIIGTLGADYSLDNLPSVTVNRDRLVAVLPELKSWVETINNTLQPNSQSTALATTLETRTAITDTQTANLLGALEGTEPTLKSEVVVVGAHVDHLGIDGATKVLYPGADDDASGTAVLLELARAAAFSEPKPRRTLLFAAFNAEEQGLFGSCHYVATPVFALDNTKAMLSLDMVGAGDGAGLVLFGATDPKSSWLADLMSLSAKAEGLSYTVQRQGASGNSDDKCFAAQGVPAVLAFTQGPHGAYHSPKDSLAGIDDASLEAASRLVWATLHPLALGNEAAGTR